MSDIKEILNNFEPISLKQLEENASLMDRRDTKFIIKHSLLPEILTCLSQEYYALEIGNVREFDYTNVYYDTPSLNLFRCHHNGKLNRYKVRLRRYEDVGTNFFEVKFKSNKDRTIKKRVKVKEFSEEIVDKEWDFLLSYSYFQRQEMVVPVVNVIYKRITLVNKKFTDRVTIDINLCFNNHEKEADMNNIVIIELKQSSHTQSLLKNILKEKHIHPFSFSKYCMGICKLYPHVKMNTFKMKLKKINAI